MKIAVTNYEKGQYWQELQEIGDVNDAMHMVNQYPEITYQTVTGFGGAFTDASGYNLSLLGEKSQQEVMDAYFSPEGLGYNMCRTHINSCDFALGNYAYVEDAADTEFKSFTIERDEKYLLPMLRRAKAMVEENGQELTMLASPWSPPAFMKTNGEMNHGGKLKAEYADTWARYIVKYLQVYEEAGIKISYLTVQNEPMAVQTWDSCIYTAEEERDFVRDHLGPVMEKSGYGHVKILIWDHNKEIMYDRAKTAYDDPEASKYIYGMAFHWYTGDHFEMVRLVHEKYPDKALYFTEGCVEYSRFGESNEVNKAEMYAHDILGNFNAGMNGYMDWNLLLDELGGPNHVKNYCAAPVMCDTKTDQVEKRLSYYYIGHFSRYIKPGAKRTAVSSYNDGLKVTGFVNPDGSKVVVLMNKSDKEMPVSLRIGGGEEAKSFRMEPHTIATVVM